MTNELELKSCRKAFDDVYRKTNPSVEERIAFKLGWEAHELHTRAQSLISWLANIDKEGLAHAVAKARFYEMGVPETLVNSKIAKGFEFHATAVINYLQSTLEDGK